MSDAEPGRTDLFRLVRAWAGVTLAGNLTKENPRRRALAFDDSGVSSSIPPSDYQELANLRSRSQPEYER